MPDTLISQYIWDGKEVAVSEEPRKLNVTDPPAAGPVLFKPINLSILVFSLIHRAVL